MKRWPSLTKLATSSNVRPLYVVSGVSVRNGSYGSRTRLIKFHGGRGSRRTVFASRGVAPGVVLNVNVAGSKANSPPPTVFTLAGVTPPVVDGRNAPPSLLLY